MKLPTMPEYRCPKCGAVLRLMKEREVTPERYQKLADDYLLKWMTDNIKITVPVICTGCDFEGEETLAARKP